MTKGYTLAEDYAICCYRMDIVPQVRVLETHLGRLPTTEEMAEWRREGHWQRSLMLDGCLPMTDRAMVDPNRYGLSRDTGSD